jgi:competence protein ComEA
MKYVIASVAVLAAIAALVFRPPHSQAVIAASPQSSPFARHFAPAPHRTEQIVVYVAGEVERPGVYRFAPDARATDAIERAGGVKTDADTVAVNLAAPLHDGDEVAVPKIGATAPKARRATRVPHPRATRRPRTSRNTRATNRATEHTQQPVDINSADENALQTLPGIGPALAARIIAFREMNGPFDSVDDLADVSGVTPRMIDDITPYAIVR